MDLHVFPIPIPPPASLPIRSFWVFPVHQPWALVSCIHHGLVICFTLDNILVSMIFSQNIPPSPSPTESKSLFCTSVFCHLFLISSASVRPTPFLSFIVTIFAGNIPLVSLIFLKRSLVSHSIVFLYFFTVITEEGFLIFLSYSLELCIQMRISSLFSFAFRFSSFHSYL